MADGGYFPNPLFEQEIAADPETKRAIGEFADLAFEGARLAAPVRTGKYLSRLTEEDSGVIGIGSWSPFWHFIEFGSVHNSPHAPLRRGVEYAGCLFVDPFARPHVHVLRAA